MLPIMGSILTMRSSAWASTLIGACIVVPTVIVAGVAPWVGRQADAWGRRPLLLLCFAALALRGVFFALVSSPYLIVAVQILDGVCAAVLGVVLPLVVADLMRGTGRFNLGLGIVGSAVGIGAALSTTLAGYMMDHFGSSLAFWSLAAVAVGGLGLVWLLLPETRPEFGAGADAVADPSLKGRGGLRQPRCWYAERHCRKTVFRCLFRAPIRLRPLNFNQVPRKLAACLSRWQSAQAHLDRGPIHMNEAYRYAQRPFALLGHYIGTRPIAHAAILIAVLGAVGCSVGAQYGVKVLVDTLSAGLYADDSVRNAWLGLTLLATLDRRG